MTLRVTKGHGTENDFLLVLDPEGSAPVSPSLVAELCDRRSGLGADGLIRAVRSSALPEGEPLAGDAEWFMDYRNADGSLAQMCGNGVRVFVAFLLREGLITLDGDAPVSVGSRAGVIRVRRDRERFAVDLGPWEVCLDQQVQTSLGVPGTPVRVGTPHVVVAMPDVQALASAPLGTPPRLTPAPAEGANVELVVAEPGRLQMRVHERGVGETRSCGTGAAAAALAARAWAGANAPDEWAVHVPGGRLRVRVTDGSLMAGANVELAGPAVIVADASLDSEWLAARSL